MQETPFLGRTPRGGSPLPVGKVPVGLLRRLLRRYSGSKDPRVIVGPGIGLDAAVIRMGRQALVAKTDPITFVADDVATYAALINANDLAATGAEPKWLLATVLFPPGRTTALSVSRVFRQLNGVCRRLGVALCGGHTEVTDAVARPVVVGCLLGEAPMTGLVTAAGAREGDVVLLTKGLAIEAVSILARERSDAIRRRYGARFLSRCRRYLTDPGISVLKEARAAMAAGGVHAMHDPTEGGLSTALYEVAEAAGVGFRIEARAIPILPEAARLCADFGLDPLGAIASGALLLCADPARADRMAARLRGAGAAAARIGTVVPRRQGVVLIENGRMRPFPRFARDELTRALERSER